MFSGLGQSRFLFGCLDVLSFCLGSGLFCWSLHGYSEPVFVWMFESCFFWVFSSKICSCLSDTKMQLLLAGFITFRLTDHFFRWMILEYRFRENYHRNIYTHWLCIATNARIKFFRLNFVLSEFLAGNE